MNAEKLALEFTQTILRLPVNAQEQFFEKLKESGELTEEEIQAMQISVAYASFDKDMDKMKAAKKALGTQLYKMFTNS